MVKPEDMHPTTDAEVFDMLHDMFGIGDYNEDDDRPWHKARMVEIAKIKAIRTKRRWSFGDFAMVARYCYTQSIPVRKAWDLLQHHGPARLAAVNNERLQREERVQEAVSLELRAGLADADDWAGRLARATGRGRDELFLEWESTRKPMLEEALCRR